MFNSHFSLSKFPMWHSLSLVIVLVCSTGCTADDTKDMGGQEGEPHDPNPDVDADADADGDADADADWDADGDTDADTDADSDADGDTDTDSDADSDSDADADSDDTGLEDTGFTFDCDTESDVTLFLSPDDSNSMSSPVQIREAVLASFSINSLPIRTYEFMNYYDFDYPHPMGEEAVSVSAQMVQDTDMEPGTYDLQIGLTSKAAPTWAREPMNIVLSLDTSGSMGGEPIRLLKKTARTIAGQLRSGDLISMVVWDTSHAILLENHEVTGAEDEALLAHIDSISAGGGTNLHAGLMTAYSLAEEAYDPSRINRVVLISDGGANAGITSIQLIAEHAGSHEEDGIYMVGVGVGGGYYHDELMDDVTDAGKGAAVFLHSDAEVEKIFGDRFMSTMDVAARNVEVQLDLPAGFEIVKFSGEEMSTVREEVDPQHLAPNDSMVFLQTIRTCDPDSVTGDTTVGITVYYQDADTFETRELHYDATFDALLDGEVKQLRKGQAVFAYAEGLKSFRNADSPSEAASVIETTMAVVARAESALPGDSDLAEIRSVLEAL